MNPQLEKLLDEINKLPPAEQEAALARLLKALPTADDDKKSPPPLDICWRL